MSWARLFERAAAYEVTVEEIRRRDGTDGGEGGQTSEQSDAERRDDR